MKGELVRGRRPLERPALECAPDLKPFFDESSVKNPERHGLARVSDGFEVFDFAGMIGAGSDYLAN